MGKTEEKESNSCTQICDFHSPINVKVTVALRTEVMGCGGYSGQLGRQADSSHSFVLIM